MTRELRGIVILTRGEKSNYNIFGTTPNYLGHLQIFGEVGIVMAQSRKDTKQK